MSSIEIQKSVKNIINKFSKESFIFDFLEAYGVTKSVITRLKKGDFNRSKVEGEIILAKKIIFRTQPNEKLLSYIDDISKNEKVLRHNPRFAIIVDDKYEHLVAKDLKLGKALDIKLTELPEHYDFFLPLAGSEVYNSSNDNEADRNAAYKMANLYDRLIEENPDTNESPESIHKLNLFLSRLLFCFFAEDTGIFPEDSIFTNTLAQHTDNSGHDTHIFLDELFERLNTRNSEGYPAFLAKFPYVNGGLFKDSIRSPKFSAKARTILVELGGLQWKDINPDIFGSMIQAVTAGEDRGKLGQHYTSVPNILKLIKPLFLEELYGIFESATSINQLYKLQNRLANIKFFDPACGSGNFLIITYKEIRVLEIEVIKKIVELTEDNLLLTFASQIKISQFYGIEIDDFAHEMAILSLWLTEHQMNIIFEEQLFEHAVIDNILPLKEAGNITQGNATRMNWKKICPLTLDEEAYIIGNPPYLGASKLSIIQKNDLASAMPFKSIKKLDYISAWFYKGCLYIKGYNAKYSFVSTNSICQGEQVDLLWSNIFNQDVEIEFAYQSFKWTNNAKGNAGVTVVIIGLRNKSNHSKFIFEDNFKREVKNINAYLRNESDTVIKPLSNKNKILNLESPVRVGYISKSNHLFLTEHERNRNINSKNKIFIRQLIGAEELINDIKKYCLYINDKDCKIAMSDDFIKSKVNLCSKERNDSIKPYKFCKKIISQDADYVVLPRVSSGNRSYLPVGVFKGMYAFNDSVQIIENPRIVTMAILLSSMHMIWVKAVGGKLKNDIRYSSTLCFNTFPFPDVSNTQEETLNQYVFDILEARANHAGKTMAWMYNSDTMPADLKEAHQALDEAIDKCYRLQPFKSDTERLEYLFKLYEKMIAEE